MVHYWILATIVLGLASRQRGPEVTALRIALAVWLVSVFLLILLRRSDAPRRMGQRSAIAALA